MQPVARLKWLLSIKQSRNHRDQKIQLAKNLTSQRQARHLEEHLWKSVLLSRVKKSGATRGVRRTKTTSCFTGIVTTVDYPN